MWSLFIKKIVFAQGVFSEPRCFALAPQDGAHHRADAGGEGEGREAVRIYPEVDETHRADEAVSQEEDGQG